MRVDLRRNGGTVCRAYAGIRDENAGNEIHSSSCGGIVGLEEGREIRGQLGVIAIALFAINVRRHLSRRKITNRAPLGSNSFIVMQFVAKILQKK